MATTPRQWSLPRVSLNGEVRGDTPTTVFLHGFGGSSLDWNPIWRTLNPAMAAIRYDLRGFGDSQARDAGAFSHADDLLALLDSEKVARADLVGMSMGGSVALNFALYHPDRVRRLALVSPGLMGWDWSEDWRAEWRIMTSHARAGNMEGAKAAWAAHPLFAPARSKPAILAPLTEGIARYSGAEWIADHQQPVLPDVDRLATLACPTLLLSGALDLPDFRLIADLIEGCVADVRRIDVPDCGHMLPLEAPELCAAAIGEYLG